TFNLNPANGCVNNTFTPNNLSTGPINTYEWTVNPNSGFTFQSGNSNSFAPTFRFTQPGVYDVGLNVIGYCNENDTSTEIIIRGKPIVQLPPDTTYCGSQTLNFSDAHH